MVRKIGVHDYDKGAGCEFHSVDVGGAEAEFSGARLKDDTGGSVEVLELLGHLEGAVWGAIVDYY